MDDKTPKSLSTPIPFTFPNFDIPRLPTMAEHLARANLAFTAKNLFPYLQEAITQFERSLGQESEVGIRLVNFGAAVEFRVSRIGYVDPSLIWFEGTLTDGTYTKLIQHTSQISILLLSMQRISPNEPKRSIEFDVSGL